MQTEQGVTRPTCHLRAHLHSLTRHVSVGAAPSVTSRRRPDYESGPFTNRPVYDLNPMGPQDLSPSCFKYGTYDRLLYSIDDSIQRQKNGGVELLLNFVKVVCGARDNFINGPSVCMHDPVFDSYVEHTTKLIGMWVSQAV